MKKMKLNIKNYLRLIEIKNKLYYKKEGIDEKGNEDLKNILISIKQYEKICLIIKRFNTVNIRYSVGSRQYYENVVKIGKTYLKGRYKINKTSDCWNIKEIPKITKEHKKEMISDTYYY